MFTRIIQYLFPKTEACHFTVEDIAPAVKYGSERDPKTGVRLLVPTNQADAALIDSVNAHVINIGEFRREHFRQTEPEAYLKSCEALGIDPDLTSPPPPYYTGDYRDWAAATINKAAA